MVIGDGVEVLRFLQGIPYFSQKQDSGGPEEEVEGSVGTECVEGIEDKVVVVVGDGVEEGWLLFLHEIPYCSQKQGSGVSVTG